MTPGVRRRTRTSRWVGVGAVVLSVPRHTCSGGCHIARLHCAPCRARTGMAPAATLGGSLVPDPACICLPVCLPPYLPGLQATDVVWKLMVCLTLFALANFLKSVLTKLLSSHFYKYAPTLLPDLSVRLTCLGVSPCFDAHACVARCQATFNTVQAAMAERQADSMPLPPGAGQGGPGDWVCHSNANLLSNTLVCKPPPLFSCCHRTAHFMKVKAAIEKEYWLLMLSQPRPAPKQPVSEPPLARLSHFAYPSMGHSGPAAPGRQEAGVAPRSLSDTGGLGRWQLGQISMQPGCCRAACVWRRVLLCVVGLQTVTLPCDWRLAVMVARPGGCLLAGSLRGLTALWVPIVCRVQAEAQEQDCPPHYWWACKRRAALTQRVCMLWRGALRLLDACRVSGKVHKPALYLLFAPLLLLICLPTQMCPPPSLASPSSGAGRTAAQGWRTRCHVGCWATAPATHAASSWQQQARSTS